MRDTYYLLISIHSDGIQERRRVRGAVVYCEHSYHPVTFLATCVYLSAPPS
jgi:hypothetical protein